MAITFNHNDKLYVSGSNVGIGTDSPQRELHIKGDTWAEMRLEGRTFASGHGATLEFYSEGTALADIYASTDKHLYFRTNGSTERMRITSAGNVGIGTTGPTEKLHIYAENPYIKLDSSSTVTGVKYATTTGAFFSGMGYATGGDDYQIYDIGASALRFIINSAGNVGIRTTSPTRTFQVGGAEGQISSKVGSLEGMMKVMSSKVYIGSQSSHNLALMTGAAERITIDTSGKVGIGTSAPSRILHIRKDVHNGIGSVIRLENSTGGGDNKVGILLTDGTYNSWIKGGRYNSETKSFLSFETTDSEAVRIDGDGNVGIGTTSPSSGKLVVEGDNYVITNSGKSLGGIDLRTNANPGAGLYTGGISFGGASTGRAAISGVQSPSGNDGDRQGLAFFTHASGTGAADSSEAMRIQSDGNVGIGTTSPNTKLHVNVASTADYVINANDRLKVKGDGTLWWGSAADYGNLTWDTGKAIVKGQSGLALSLGANNSQDHLYINTSGNVGIGTTAPGEKLDVVGTIRSTGNEGKIKINSTATNGKQYEFISIDTGNLGLYDGTAYRFWVGGNGNVGIGTTSPAKKLDVRGGYFITSDGGTNEEAFVQGGNGYAYFGNYSTGKAAFGNSENWTTLVADGGNVGIGTSSPNTFLHIAGQGNRSGGQIYLGNQDDGSVKYSLITSAHYNAATEPEGFTLITGLSTATENTVSIGGFVYESNPATDIRFFTHTATTHTTGGSERMRITSSGNVGIGTNSPGSTLEVDGSFNVVNGNNSITHFNYVDGSTNYVRGITYFDNASAYFTGGNVGIGTTSPTNKLDVRGLTRLNALSLRGGTDNYAHLSRFSWRDTNSSSTGTTWKKVCGVSLGSGSYSALSMEVVHYYPGSNHGNSASLSKHYYSISFRRSSGTQDNQDNAVVYGRDANFIRVVRTALGEFELQARANGSHLSYSVDITQTGGNSDAITMVENSSTSGNTTGTIYAAVSSANTVVSLPGSLGAGSNVYLNHSGHSYLNGGNVGIGTTTPDAPLTVHSSTDPEIRFGYSSTQDHRIQWDSSKVYIHADPENANASSALGLYVDGTSRLYIPDSGNVGIGTTDPTAALHVDIPGNTVAFRATRNGGADGDLELTFGSAIAGYNSKAGGHRWFESSSEKMRLTGGNLGIGTTSPKAALDVKGRFVVDSKTMTITNLFDDALTVVMSNHSGCYVKITAFGDWGSHSSISYLGEFFLNNGAGSYNEPGMIIRQEDNTYNDAIQAQIVDPGGTSGDREFIIQLKATATASFTAYITYTIQGMFVSAS